MRQVVFVVCIEGGDHDGHDVTIGDQALGFRCYDGSGDDDVAAEIGAALGRLLLAYLSCGNNETGRAHPGNWLPERPEWT